MAGKRSDRRGSVKPYKHGDGWHARVSLGTDENGKRIQKSKVFPAKIEAEKWVARMLADLDSGKLVVTATPPEVPKLRDWVDDWFARHVESHLAARTARSYRMAFEQRILPSLGDMRLDRLKPSTIKNFVTMLGESARADKRPGKLTGATQMRHFRALSSCLQAAVYDGLIESNPCKSVKPPREVKKEATFYDEATISTMLSALDAEPLWFRAAVLLAVGCGMRRGEIVGLSWADVDWDASCIRVRQAADALKGGQKLKRPKTAGSVRTILMPEIVSTVLTEWKEAQKGSPAMVFTIYRGKWMRADTVSEHWQAFLTRAKLPPMTFHGLRHTAATLLLGKGLPVRTVSSILGHSTAATTLNVYAHVLGATQQAAADTMQAALVKKSVKSEPSEASTNLKSSIS